MAENIRTAVFWNVMLCSLVSHFSCPVTSNRIAGTSLLAGRDVTS
jgi:hypothetical protein